MVTTGDYEGSVMASRNINKQFLALPVAIFIHTFTFHIHVLHCSPVHVSILI